MRASGGAPDARAGSGADGDCAPVSLPFQTLSDRTFGIPNVNRIAPICTHTLQALAFACGAGAGSPHASSVERRGHAARHDGVRRRVEDPPPVVSEVAAPSPVDLERGGVAEDAVHERREGDRPDSAQRRPHRCVEIGPPLEAPGEVLVAHFLGGPDDKQQ